MKRNTLLDSLKCHLIVLVVVGHVITPYRNDNAVIQSLHNLIYSFHMPLFILISGFLSKTKDVGKLKKQVLRILETYLIVQFVGYFREILNGTFTLEMAITPWWISWFLLSLICWKIAVFILPLRKNMKAALIISVALSLIAGFIKYLDYPLSLSRTIVFFPFFLFGYYASSGFFAKIRSYNKLYGIGTIIAIFLMFFIVQKSWTTTFHGATSYMLSANIPASFIFRCSFLFVASLMSTAFINIIPDSKVFSQKGLNSLLYYVYHAPLVLLFRELILTTKLHPSLFLMIIASSFIIIIISFFAKTKASHIILNPVTYLNTRNE